MLDERSPPVNGVARAVFFPHYATNETRRLRRTQLGELRTAPRTNARRTQLAMLARERSNAIRELVAFLERRNVHEFRHVDCGRTDRNHFVAELHVCHAVFF